MAGETAMFKFLSPRRRPQSTDIQAAVFWGVAATTTAIWLIQVDKNVPGSYRPFDWIKKTFLEKGDSEGK